MGVHLLAAVRGIGGVSEEEPSLREQLKATVNGMIDDLSDEDLKKISDKKNFEWLSSGVKSHFKRVRESSNK